jgi:integration host factor subunit alpha
MMKESETLTKDLLTEMIRCRAGFSLRESKDILDLLLEQMKGVLERGYNLKISGFGHWKISSKNARAGRNIHTGERLEIAARRVVSFHPAEKFRELIGRERDSL